MHPCIVLCAVVFEPVPTVLLPKSAADLRIAGQDTGLGAEPPRRSRRPPVAPAHPSGLPRPSQAQAPRSGLPKPSHPLLLPEQYEVKAGKTPTDDEINWLWDAVRKGLHGHRHAVPEQQPGSRPGSAASVQQPDSTGWFSSMWINPAICAKG